MHLLEPQEKKAGLSQLDPFQTLVRFVLSACKKRHVYLDEGRLKRVGRVKKLQSDEWKVATIANKFENEEAPMAISRFFLLFKATEIQESPTKPLGQSEPELHQSCLSGLERGHGPDCT